MLLVLAVFLTLVFTCASAAAEYDLGGISGKISIDESAYIILTPDNLGEHPDLLSELGKSAEELKTDWESRGVLLKAWTKDRKTSVEVSVYQDSDSARYYDLSTQSNATRKQYLRDQVAAHKAAGYKINESEFKLHAKSGYYVVLEYVLPEGDITHRGYMRKTIRNGYVLQMDYEVFDRRPTKSDKDKGRAIINTIVIDEVAPVNAPQADTADQGAKPASGEQSSSSVTVSSAAAGTLYVTVPPPAETNDGVFTIEGTAYPGSRIIIVAMRWSGAATRFYADTTKGGNFKAKITLPDEGLYQFTINMDISDQIVADQVLNSTTYSKTLLPYTLDAEIPEEITTDELVISGVTVKNVTIQCLVSNGSTTFDKTVKTNGTGKFKFKIPTTVEAEYDITLAFSKKDLNSKRLNVKTTRTMSAAAVQEKTASKAVHPAYNLLTKKLDTYIGKTMVYTVYITDVEEKGDEWIITAAMKKNKDTYSNYLVYMAKEDPGLSVGSRVKLYGSCVGAYLVQSEEENASYPGFDFLFAE